MVVHLALSVIEQRATKVAWMGVRAVLAGVLALAIPLATATSQEEASPEAMPSVKPVPLDVGSRPVRVRVASPA